MESNKEKDSTNDEWVFDSLVCFLHGPIFNAPLQTFIEEKSLLFDPNLQPDATNPEIITIWNEYKNLVDYMLGSFMEEMQITPEQFELACMEGRNQNADNPFHIHQGLFQQIWAANDIKIFMRMMTQRNVELQLQALDLIEKNQLALLQDGEYVDNAGSLEEQREKYADVEELIAKSVERELESPEAALTPEHEVAEVADKFQRLNLFFEKDEKVNPDDVVSRQQYLKQQRDKIVEIKKKTRAKQLQETVSRSGGGGGGNSAASISKRPISAQVAQRLLENGGKADIVVEKAKNSTGAAGEGEGESNNGLNSALQLRRTLAKRLRSEVVEQN